MVRPTVTDHGRKLEDLEEEGGFRFFRFGPEYYQVYDGTSGEHLGVVYQDGPDWVSDEPHGCFDSRLGAAGHLLAESHRA